MCSIDHSCHWGAVERRVRLPRARRRFERHSNGREAGVCSSAGVSRVRALGNRARLLHLHHRLGAEHHARGLHLSKLNHLLIDWI